MFKFIFKSKKSLKEKGKAKFRINDWMELTKEERIEQDFNEKNQSMKKKKELLKSIRKEYMKIKNKQK